jgi:hypothetical protein
LLSVILFICAGGSEAESLLTLLDSLRVRIVIAAPNGPEHTTTDLKSTGTDIVATPSARGDFLKRCGLC